LGTSDSRWEGLRGVDGIPYDPRPALNKLASRVDEAAAWDELWQQLYHQGGVAEVAYAAVPELVRVHRERGVPEWNTYALVGTIELGRDSEGNPPLPDWIQTEYSTALSELAAMSAQEILDASNVTLTRSILAILAIQTGARTSGHFLLDYEEDELLARTALRWKPVTKSAPIQRKCDFTSVTGWR
jgi:hypothetical protein